MTATDRLKKKVVEKLEKHFILPDKYGSYCADCGVYKPVGSKTKQHRRRCIVSLTERALGL